MSRQREAGILIAKIHQLSGRIFNQKLKNNKLDKLNPAQGRIMFVLWNKNSLPIHELSKETQLSKSTLTSMLDRLEEAGYIIADISTGSELKKKLKYCLRLF